MSKSKAINHLLARVFSNLWCAKEKALCVKHIVPFTVVIEFIVAGIGDQASKAHTEGEKYLGSGIDPNL